MATISTLTRTFLLTTFLTTIYVQSATARAGEMWNIPLGFCTVGVIEDRGEDILITVYNRTALNRTAVVSTKRKGLAIRSNDEKVKIRFRNGQGAYGPDGCKLSVLLVEGEGRARTTVSLDSQLSMAAHKIEHDEGDNCFRITLPKSSSYAKPAPSRCRLGCCSRR